MVGGFADSLLAVAAVGKGANPRPIGAQLCLHQGQAGGHLLPLGLQGGAVGKGQGQGLAEAEALHGAATLELDRRGQAQGRGRAGLRARQGAFGGRVGRQQVGGQGRGGDLDAGLSLWFGGNQGIEGTELGIELSPAALQIGGAGVVGLAGWVWPPHRWRTRGQALRCARGTQPQRCDGPRCQTKGKE